MGRFDRQSSIVLSRGHHLTAALMGTVLLAGCAGLPTGEGPAAAASGGRPTTSISVPASSPSDTGSTTRMTKNQPPIQVTEADTGRSFRVHVGAHINVFLWSPAGRAWSGVVISDLTVLKLMPSPIALTTRGARAFILEATRAGASTVRAHQTLDCSGQAACPDVANTDIVVSITVVP
jgi:hypothetical protein